MVSKVFFKITWPWRWWIEFVSLASSWNYLSRWKLIRTSRHFLILGAPIFHSPLESQFFFFRFSSFLGVFCQMNRWITGLPNHLLPNQLMESDAEKTGPGIHWTYRRAAEVAEAGEWKTGVGWMIIQRFLKRDGFIQNDWIFRLLSICQPIWDGRFFFFE